jgi:hypothetical protein
MSERKGDAIGELDDEHLSSVSGGVGVGTAGAEAPIDPAAAATPNTASARVKSQDFHFVHSVDKATNSL